VNEIQNGSATPAATSKDQPADSTAAATDQTTGDQPVASSKHKKKKGLKKIIPF
jgi:hypothetical protein